MRTFVIVAVVALAGCADDADDATESGPTDDSPDSAIVAIVTPNGDSSFVCSGVVIAPRVVLSAGHCFIGGNYDKKGWSFEVVIGADARDPKARHVSVTPHPHPDWQSGAQRPDLSDADIAIAIADADLRVATRAWSRRPPPSTIIGATARYAGYGAHVTSEKGRRHIETARVVGIRSDVIDMEADPSPCHGDSGGPLLVDVDGVETVIGVGHVAIGDGAEGCRVGADYTRLDLFTDFIGSF